MPRSIVGLEDDLLSSRHLVILFSYPSLKLSSFPPPLKHQEKEEEFLPPPFFNQPYENGRAVLMSRS